jgi:hypothetical protein
MSMEECEADVKLTQGWPNYDRNGRLYFFMVQLRALNPAASALACLSTNAMPKGLGAVFRHYLDSVWYLTAIWTVLTTLEMAGVVRATSVVASTAEVQQLANAIAATTSAEDIEKIDSEHHDLQAIPEKAVKLFPPGGIIMSLGMVVLDAFLLDGITVANMLLSFNFKFAMCLVALITMTFCKYMFTGNIFKIVPDGRASIRRGILTDSLIDILEDERATEAPSALALTAYAFPLMIRNTFSFVSIIASMAVAVFGVAQTAYETCDMKTTDEDVDVGFV